VRAVALASAAGLGLWLASLSAGAAPCGSPDILDTLPASGAEGIPTDAALTAHYAASAEYLGEEVVLVEDGVERPLPATFDATEGLLIARPPESLRPGGSYAVRWPGLRSVNAAGRGLSKEVRFTTGAGPDGETPRFEGLTAAAWDHQRKTNDCTDEIEARYRFDLTIGEASDDAGRGALLLVVFQTAGPEIGAAPRPVLARALPAAGESVRIELPVRESVGRICFAAVVRDLAGKASGGGDREVCVETVEPPFFNGCSLAQGRGSGGAGVGLLLALAALAGRPRRPRPRHAPPA
jgi:hypothetical protein